ncbi:hypothetical protein CDAR_169801 [Caerostris darwini]|uniref:Uncharacterized protein n=1 Tax=Caerostris darwini TaxID=1538125 RepID=A0AAV4TVE6_9ARAC|nr:hypothetical protein CDAR_169801 [Caerostris darwini]
MSICKKILHSIQQHLFDKISRKHSSAFSSELIHFDSLLHSCREIRGFSLLPRKGEAVSRVRPLRAPGAHKLSLKSPGTLFLLQRKALPFLCYGMLSGLGRF